MVNPLFSQDLVARAERQYAPLIIKLEATRHEYLRKDFYVEFSGTAVVPVAQLSKNGLDLFGTNSKEADVPIRGRYWKSYFRRTFLCNYAHCCFPSKFLSS